MVFREKSLKEKRNCQNCWKISQMVLLNHDAQIYFYPVAHIFPNLLDQSKYLFFLFIHIRIKFLPLDSFIKNYSSAKTTNKEVTARSPMHIMLQSRKERKKKIPHGTQFSSSARLRYRSDRRKRSLDASITRQSGRDPAAAPAIYQRFWFFDPTRRCRQIPFHGPGRDALSCHCRVGSPLSLEAWELWWVCLLHR